MNKLFSVCLIGLLFALAGCSSNPKQGLSSEEQSKDAVSRDMSTMPGHDMNKMPGHDMSKMPGHQHQHQHRGGAEYRGLLRHGEHHRQHHQRGRQDPGPDAGQRGFRPEP